MADARGDSDLNLTSITATNLIRPDGHIDALNLEFGDLLVVRGYDGDPAKNTGGIAITVDQSFLIGGGRLRIVFEEDAWDSTVSFLPGIPVTLGGTLELAFANDVNLASQVGRTFNLFDWSDVAPTGAFTISGPYRWDLSKLYTTGEVTLNAVPESTSLVLLTFGVLLIRVPRRACLILAIVLLAGSVPSAIAELPMTGAYVPQLQEVDAALESFMLGKAIPGGRLQYAQRQGDLRAGIWLQ